MIPRLFYKNNFGQVYDFDRSRIWPLVEELYDFSVTYEAMNNKIASHKIDEVEIPISVGIDTDNPAREMNRLYRVLMPDVEQDSLGRLYDGAWFVECILKQSKKRRWYRDGNYRTYDLSLWSPDPVWTRESSFSFDIKNTVGLLGYPHGYPHGYGSTTPVELLRCNSISPCDVRIDIKGPVDSPVVSIGSNRYTADVEVPDGGVLTFDSRQGTVSITTADGSSFDVFDSTPDMPPGSGEYPFEKINPGSHYLSWDGSFTVAGCIYEQGRERQWS